ncbi:MAG: hypothetical protein ACI9DH_001554 [Halioglobus sp.]|jgi:hypothetical protein
MGVNHQKTTLYRGLIGGASRFAACCKATIPDILTFWSLVRERKRE